MPSLTLSFAFCLQLLLTLPGAHCQETQYTWGAVVFTYHGESEPEISITSPNLTPLGAQQALAAGSAIRTRFVQGPGDNITSSYAISGISHNIIDNEELSIWSTDDDYTAASAQAFMQGLYPPLDDQVSETALADGTRVMYPLNGYQYATVNTISASDYNYLWLAGNDECVNYDLSTSNYTMESSFISTESSSYDFYQRLLNSVFSTVTPAADVSYNSAYDLYNYAAYQYVHNSTVLSTLSTIDLANLRALASQYEYALNGDLTASGVTPGDKIRSVAGQTLAGKVVRQLDSTVGSAGEFDKLSLLFGSYEPFVAFFALAKLDNVAAKFQTLPNYGSVMVFELYSYGENISSFPSDTEDLFVRFLFRNGSDSGTPLYSYPLFGRGIDETDMTWDDFQAGMADIALDQISDWCILCGSTALYCPEFTDNSSSSSSDSSSSSSGSKHLSNAAAGVIGAVVTLTIALLLILTGVCVGGLRVVRYRAATGGGAGTLGGFKGAEKLASDTDVNVIKADGVGGAPVVRHERVGSWEMGDAKPTPGAHSGAEDGAVREGFGSLDKDLESGRVVSTADYTRHGDDDDEVEVSTSGHPVKIDDRI